MDDRIPDNPQNLKLQWINIVGEDTTFVRAARVLYGWLCWYLGTVAQDKEDGEISKRKWQGQEQTDVSEKQVDFEALELVGDDEDDVHIIPIENKSSNGAKKFALSNSPQCSSKADMRKPFVDLISPEPEPVQSTSCSSANVDCTSSCSWDDENWKLAGERPSNCLLRPIVIDACNVGYQYGKKQKIMDCKGVAIAVQYFVEKGHVVNAFLPDTFPRRSVCINKQMLEELERLDIVVFTQSREIWNAAAEKFMIITNYDDLVILKQAYDTGAVVISRDQYKDVQKDYPQWTQTITTRVLQPCFVREKFVLPVDGPLGRFGANTDETLRCSVEDDDIPRLVDRQLTKSEQRSLLAQLDLIVRGLKPEKTENGDRFTTPRRSLFGNKHPSSAQQSMKPSTSTSNPACDGDEKNSEVGKNSEGLDRPADDFRGPERPVEMTEKFRRYMVEEIGLGEEDVDRVLCEHPQEDNFNYLVQYLLPH